MPGGEQLYKPEALCRSEEVPMLTESGNVGGCKADRTCLGGFCGDLG